MSSNIIIPFNEKNKNKNGVIISDFDYFEIKFNKNSDDLYAGTKYTSFIKGCEKLIRTSTKYTDYINYLKTTIGLNHCMLLSNVNDDIAKIEMHHGPILNLFDYCKIICNDCLEKKIDINTFMIANIVINEHFFNHIQVVMLTKSLHQLVHSRQIFIHPSQAWGNLNIFLEKYKLGLETEMIDKINDYINLCEEYYNKSYDNNLLDLNENI